MDTHKCPSEQDEHFAAFGFEDTPAVEPVPAYWLERLALVAASFGADCYAFDFGHSRLLRGPNSWHPSLKTASFSLS